MLFNKADKERIVAGELTATVRTWKRCQAKTGGQYNIAPYGAIEVSDVAHLPLHAVSGECDDDTVTAGGSLADFLSKPPR